MGELSRAELHKMAENTASSDVCKKVSAKQYLGTIRRIESTIERKTIELEKLRAEAVGINGVRYDGIRVQSSNSGDRMAQTVAVYVDLENEIRAEVTELAKTKHAIMNQINGMEKQDYATLLFKRYVEYKSLESISAEMNYNYGYTRQLHGYALQAFAKQYLADC